MRVIPSLQVERVELTSREHSSSPRRRSLSQSDLSPSAIHHQCQGIMSLSARSHTYHATARATHRLLWALTALQHCPSQPTSISSTALPTSPTTPSSSPSSISASTNATPSAPNHACTDSTAKEVESMRTRSGFWVMGHDRNGGNRVFSASQLLLGPRHTPRRRHRLTIRTMTWTAPRSWQARATTVQSPLRAHWRLHAGGGVAAATHG